MDRVVARWLGVAGGAAGLMLLCNLLIRATGYAPPAGAGRVWLAGVIVDGVSLALRA